MAFDPFTREGSALLNAARSAHLERERRHAAAQFTATAEREARIRAVATGLDVAWKSSPELFSGVESEAAATFHVDAYIQPRS